LYSLGYLICPLCAGMYLETDPSLQREIAELIMLRRHLDSLEEKMQEKEFAVDKARLVHL